MGRAGPSQPHDSPPPPPPRCAAPWASAGLDVLLHLGGQADVFEGAGEMRLFLRRFDAEREAFAPVGCAEGWEAVAAAAARAKMRRRVGHAYRTAWGRPSTARAMSSISNLCVMGGGDVAMVPRTATGNDGAVRDVARGAFAEYVKEAASAVTPATRLDIITTNRLTPRLSRYQRALWDSGAREEAAAAGGQFSDAEESGSDDAEEAPPANHHAHVETFAGGRIGVFFVDIFAAAGEATSEGEETLVTCGGHLPPSKALQPRDAFLDDAQWAVLERGLASDDLRVMLVATPVPTVWAAHATVADRDGIEPVGPHWAHAKEQAEVCLFGCCFCCARGSRSPPPPFSRRPSGTASSPGARRAPGGRCRSSPGPAAASGAGCARS